MSFTRESDSKDRDRFLDRGPNSLRNRLGEPDSNDRKRVASEADPYGHVDSGKPGSPRKLRDFSTQSASSEDPTDIPVAVTVLRKGDPLTEVYQVLREHGGVAFGAQNEDGSWSITALEPREVEIDLGLESKRPSNWQESLSAESQAELAAALEKFSGKS